MELEYKIIKENDILSQLPFVISDETTSGNQRLFRNCNFVNIDLNQNTSNGDFITSYKIVFKKCHFSDVSFKNLDLRYMGFLSCTFENVTFYKCNMKGVMLNCCNLENLNMFGCDCNGARLKCVSSSTFSKIEQSDFKSSNIIQCNFNLLHMKDCNINFSEFKSNVFKDCYLLSCELKYVNFDETYSIENYFNKCDFDGTPISQLYVNKDLYISCTSLNIDKLPYRCPEEGSFIGYKACRGGKIVKLLIPEDAKRCSSTSNKCRCDKAIVLEIQEINGDKSDLDIAHSFHSSLFSYPLGKTVTDKEYNDDRTDDCSSGIHFYISREDAIKHFKSI